MIGRENTEKEKPYECHTNANKELRILTNPLRIKRMDYDFFFFFFFFFYIFLRMRANGLRVFANA